MDYISVREYSRRRGCSEGLVRKAIKAGKIEESAIRRDHEGKVSGILPDRADKQWAAHFNVTQVRSPKLQETLLGKPQKKPETEEFEQEPAFSSQKATPTTAKAQQVEAVYKAKLRELEYRRKTGELISKDATYRALFALGQEIRTSLQAIPDRVIDELLAAPSRNDAHTILTREIHEVLTRLANMQTIQTLEGL